MVIKVGKIKGCRKVILLLCANLVALSIAGVFAEAGLRLFKYPFTEETVPTENAVAQFDTELGWSYLPGISQTILYGSQARSVHFDENGIRVPAPGMRLDRRCPAVLFVGDSYTMGHGLSYEESFVGQFGALGGMPY